MLVFRRAYNFIKKTPTEVFSCNIYEIFKNTYFEEHLQTTASAVSAKPQTRLQRFFFYTPWKHHKTYSNHWNETENWPEMG